MPIISSEDKSYAAGVIDSDGCIRVVKEGRKDTRMRSPVYYPTVLVSQADGDALQFLQSKWGGSIHKLAQRRGRQLFIFRWTVSWKKAEEFLQDIQPFLRIKKDQASLALQVRGRDLHLQPRRSDGTQMSLSLEEIQRREQIFVQVKEMKLHHSHPILTLKGVA